MIIDEYEQVPFTLISKAIFACKELGGQQFSIMFKFRLGIFNKSPKQCSLGDMDPLFKKAVSQLPKEAQIDYCKRLIDRAKYDLENTECKKRTSELKALVKATERELEKITS